MLGSEAERAYLLVRWCSVGLTVVARRDYVVGNVGDVPKACGMGSYHAGLGGRDEGRIKLPAFEA